MLKFCFGDRILAFFFFLVFVLFCFVLYKDCRGNMTMSLNNIFFCIQMIQTTHFSIKDKQILALLPHAHPYFKRFRIWDCARSCENFIQLCFYISIVAGHQGPVVQN